MTTSLLDEVVHDEPDAVLGEADDDHVELVAGRRREAEEAVKMDERGVLERRFVTNLDGPRQRDPA